MLSSPASMLSFTGTAAHKDRALCSKSPAYTPELQRSQDHMFKTWKDHSVKQCSRAGQKELTSPLYTSHGKPLFTEKLTYPRSLYQIAEEQAALLAA